MTVGVAIGRNRGSSSFAGDQFAHDALLRFDALVGIHDDEIELGAHGQVLLEDAALENAKAFVRIGGEAHIHAGFEIFELRAAIQNALERDLQVRFEEKRHVRQRREIVNAAHPFRRATADGVARESGENVAIAQHDVAGAQQRNELPLVTVRKIGGMDQAESRGREQLALFAFAGGGFDEVRGIPLAEKNLQPLHFEPASQQVNLRGFPGAIEAFDRDQAAGKSQFRKRFCHRIKVCTALPNVNFGFGLDWGLANFPFPSQRSVGQGSGASP